MYGTYFTISKEAILKRTSQFEIFKFYMPWFEPGRTIKTPFTNENNPSFWTKVDIEGNIFFKDFGRGYSGDCFSLVMHLFNCEYHAALAKINDDLKLGLGPPLKNQINLSFKEHESLINKPKVVVEETKTVNITFRIKPWDNASIRYWLAHGASMPIVKRLGVYPISDFWIDEKRYKADPIAFAWQTLNNRVKVYQPYNTNNLKWRSNTNNQALQGEQILPSSGQLLLFQSSLKDIACVLSRYNIYSLAPNGEHGIIPKDKRESLEKRFGRIGVLYDNDAAGIKAATQICNESNYEMFVLPTIEDCKDPSDFIMNGYSPVLDDFFKKIVNF